MTPPATVGIGNLSVMARVRQVISGDAAASFVSAGVRKPLARAAHQGRNREQRIILSFSRFGLYSIKGLRMHRIGLLLLCTGLFAQDGPIGIVRGDLVLWEGTTSSGLLTVSNTTGEFRCGFDAKTWMERDGQRVAVGAFAPGDRIEIVADRKPGTKTCYARTVHAVDRPVARYGPGRRPLLKLGPSPTEAWAPRGDLTFAGVVMEVTPRTLVLRTRSEPRQTLLLRSDTRFMSEGVRVEPNALQVNTRVFVRAGRNLENEVEAYQVIWGDIFHP